MSATTRGQGMVDRSSEITYLREKAQQFRMLANTYDN
jgi:hypothetical protein